MKKDKDSKSSLVGWKSSRSRHRIDKVFPSWQHQSLFSEDSMFWFILKCRVEDRSKKMLEMLAQELWTSWKRVRNHENQRWRKANVEYCLILTSDPTGINNALQGAGFGIDLGFLASATAKAIHFWGPYRLPNTSQILVPLPLPIHCEQAPCEKRTLRCAMCCFWAEARI